MIEIYKNNNKYIAYTQRFKSIDLIYSINYYLSICLKY